MKRMNLLFIGLILISQTLVCSAQSKNNDAQASIKTNSNVEVYYFHMTRRCLTCQAVEDVTKEALKEFYGDKVPFAGYNLDEDTGKEKGESLDISGQSLVIVSGDSKINITNEGFMYARSNPDKLKQLIKEKVDPLL
jgi:hypothetical protein